MVYCCGFDGAADSLDLAGVVVSVEDGEAGASPLGGGVEAVVGHRSPIPSGVNYTFAIRLSIMPGQGGESCGQTKTRLGWVDWVSALRGQVWRYCRRPGRSVLW